MDKIGNLLPSSIRKAGAERQVKAAVVLDAVEEALSAQFGAETAACMRPTIFKNGTVTIRSARAAYAQEIVLHEVDILTRIAARLGQGTVKRLRPVS